MSENETANAYEEPDASITKDTTETNVIFVHGMLDDFGLTPAEFRVYCHINRRSGTNGAWPGIDSMAKKCCLSKPTVINAIRRLEAMEMLRVRRKEGERSRYFLTRPSVWKSPRLKIDTGQNEVTERTPDLTGTGKKEVTKVHPREVHPKKDKRVQGTLIVFSSDELPPPINTPEIRDLWDQWQEHRRQGKNKLTPEAARMQVAKLKAIGPARAAAMLKNSLEMGYTGLFEPSENGARPARTKTDYANLTKETAV
jgi:hypothetical protein